MSTIQTTLKNVLDSNSLSTSIALVEGLDLPVAPNTVWLMATIRNETQFQLVFPGIDTGVSMSAGDFCGGGNPRSLEPFSQDVVLVTSSSSLTGGIWYYVNVDGNSDHQFNVAFGWAVASGVYKSGAAESDSPTGAANVVSTSGTSIKNSKNKWAGKDASNNDATFAFQYKVEVNKPDTKSPVFTVVEVRK